MRVAIVHDYLIQFGGAERVLQVLMHMFPNAPVYTLLYDEHIMENRFSPSRIHTSMLQRVPFATSQHRFFPLFMPLFAEQFDLSAYDLVISASHSFGKGILTRSDTLHVSYCFTPTRYAWDDSHRYIREFGVPEWLRSLVPFALTYMRLWDVLAADRVDEFISISKYVAERVEKYYGRPSSVIYPPVDCQRFHVIPHTSGRYLLVSRLLQYKRIDLAIEAFNALRLPLDVVGTGPEEEHLRAIAGPTVTVHGFLPDATVQRLFETCEAFIFPQEEDFGITPLEAAACGRPVVAYAAGGALETIRDGVTGILFPEQSVSVLVEAIERLQRTSFDRNSIRAHALQFDTNRFTVRFMDEIRLLWKVFARKRAHVVPFL